MSDLGFPIYPFPNDVRQPGSWIAHSLPHEDLLLLYKEASFNPFYVEMFNYTLPISSATITPINYYCIVGRFLFVLFSKVLLGLLALDYFKKQQFRRWALNFVLAMSVDFIGYSEATATLLMFPNIAIWLSFVYVIIEHFGKGDGPRADWIFVPCMALIMGCISPAIYVATVIGITIFLPSFLMNDIFFTYYDELPQNSKLLVKKRRVQNKNIEFI